MGGSWNRLSLALRWAGKEKGAHGRCRQQGHQAYCDPIQAAPALASEGSFLNEDDTSILRTPLLLPLASISRKPSSGLQSLLLRCLLKEGFLLVPHCPGSATHPFTMRTARAPGTSYDLCLLRPPSRWPNFSYGTMRPSARRKSQKPSPLNTTSPLLKRCSKAPSF